MVGATEGLTSNAQLSEHIEIMASNHALQATRQRVRYLGFEVRVSSLTQHGVRCRVA